MYKVYLALYLRRENEHILSIYKTFLRLSLKTTDEPAESLRAGGMFTNVLAVQRGSRRNSSSTKLPVWVQLLHLLLGLDSRPWTFHDNKVPDSVVSFVNGLVARKRCACNAILQRLSRWTRPSSELRLAACHIGDARDRIGNEIARQANTHGWDARGCACGRGVIHRAT